MVKIVGPIFLMVIAIPVVAAETRAQAPKLPVAVLHADTFTDVCAEGVSIDSDRLQMSIDKMKAGGVALVGAAIWITNKVTEPMAALAYVQKIVECIKKTAGAHSKDLAVVETAAEAEAALKAGKIALVITVEGGEPAAAGPDAVKKMYDWGVRAISLTWNRDNGLGSAQNTKDDKGLTEAGRKVVTEMNRLGMMVDVSHASDKTTEGLLKASKAPAFASHANARALCGVPRNLTDAQIVAVCKGGGVVGVNFHAGHLVSKGGADIKDVAAHASWVRRLGGGGCAAIGGDLDGRIKLPEGFDDASKLQDLAQALKEASFPPPEIDGALNGNFMRYWKKVEAAASGAAPQKEAR